MFVYLMRHGIAIDREDPRCPPDPERHLTEKGRRRTTAAARGLLNIADTPTAMWSSPYRRAFETAELVAEVAGFDRPIDIVDELVPNGSVTDVAFALRTFTGSGPLLITGHAPNLDWLLAYALGLSVPAWKLKKASVACLELDEGDAHLRWLCEPRTLRALGRPVG